MKIAIVTVSDRASRGEYPDLSGPAIEEWLDQRSNRVRSPRPLADVRRVDAGAPAAPAPARGNRSRAPTGGGRLVA